MKSNSLIKNVTFEICGSFLDLLLWQIALVGASVGKSGPRGVHEAFSEADQILQKINHHTLAATWYQLKKKRLLTYKKRGNLYNAEITEFGKKRLQGKFPHYHDRRPWDNKIYLITYDIPNSASIKRDLFRRFLNQIGCKLLQESIYLTPYNPRQLVDGFVKKYKIPGTIIASDVGSDGGIGETDIKDLIVKLYSLEVLNNRYEEFIDKADYKDQEIRPLLFEYLSILKNDPQLPFKLLPGGWLGEEAHVLYEKLKSEYILSMSHVRS